MRENKDVLLERLADRIAEVVVGFDRVEAVDVTVTKLRPPIAEHVETTAVRIRRTPADFDVRAALVAPGDRRARLQPRRPRGLPALAVGELGGVVGQSQVFETDPVGGPDGQGAYLNMVVAVDTPLDPFAFVRRCQRIEAGALRQRIVHWGPRTLDVDVLFYDDVTIVVARADDPAPAVSTERRFVLTPLAEVAPERCPPGWDDALPPGGRLPRAARSLG